MAHCVRYCHTQSFSPIWFYPHLVFFFSWFLALFRQLRTQWGKNGFFLFRVNWQWSFSQWGKQRFHEEKALFFAACQELSANRGHGIRLSTHRTSHRGIMKDLQKNDTYVPILHQPLNWYNILRIKDQGSQWATSSPVHIHMQRGQTQTYTNTHPPT